MPTKCPYCSKTVYHAERQVKDGQDYHGGCLQKVIKEEKEAGKARPFQSSGFEAPGNVKTTADVPFAETNASGQKFHH